MSSFRCSAGHLAELAFGAEQVRHACPTCGTDVYKFRDAIQDDDAPAVGCVDEAAAEPKALLRLERRPVRAAIGAVLLLAAAGVCVLYRPTAVPPAPSAAPVVPVAPAPTAPHAPPAGVSISGFVATATDAGAVKLSFRLANREGARNDYPALALHWHGVPGADQLVREDAYAHPPLPFTAADVTLELARPPGATGIDVKIVY